MKRTFSDVKGTVLQQELTEQEQKNSMTVTRDTKGLHKIEIKQYFDHGEENATIKIITRTLNDMKESLEIE